MIITKNHQGRVHRTMVLQQRRPRGSSMTHHINVQWHLWHHHRWLRSCSIMSSNDDQGIQEHPAWWSPLVGPTLVQFQGLHRGPQEREMVGLTHQGPHQFLQPPRIPVHVPYVNKSDFSQVCWWRWKEAMEEELQALEAHDTWKTIPAPSGMNIVGCWWVFLYQMWCGRQHCSL